MNKSELTKKEIDIYLEIAKYGTMDDMFDLGYLIGRERASRDMLELIENFKKI